ncbi:MAG TPA: hypothetical protein VNU25_00415 [Candidatus Paceibacterota bacterium]|nr:hypothetical protein [Candidatus Paceibacterota bacterium]
MPQTDEPFCRLCEATHGEDELCTGPDGTTYDMRSRAGGLYSIHRQPLEDAPYASA